MADGVSALQGHLMPGRSGVLGENGVVLTEVHPFGLIQFAAWPGTVAQAGVEAANAAGASGAPRPGNSVSGSAGALLRIEPLKWWLVSNGKTIAPPDLPAEVGAVLDLSQSRAWLRLRGPKAATLLNHVLPLNLSDAAFPDGEVASSAFHHVGVTLWRDSREFNLFLPRSFAASLCDILIESARQYGLEIASN